MRGSHHLFCGQGYRDTDGVAAGQTALQGEARSSFGHRMEAKKRKLAHQPHVQIATGQQSIVHPSREVAALAESNFVAHANIVDDASQARDAERAMLKEVRSPTTTMKAEQTMKKPKSEKT